MSRCCYPLWWSAGDKLRETSISVLMTLETPLPGIDDPAAVEDLVLWARKLVGSPRSAARAMQVFQNPRSTHTVWA